MHYKQRKIQELVYFIKTGSGEDDFEEFYRFPASTTMREEMLAKQLCTYLVLEGKQFRLLYNEMNGEEEYLVLEDEGMAKRYMEEAQYDGKEIVIEFRQFKPYGDCPVKQRLKVMTHLDVLEFLTKDIVDIPDIGQREVDSTEVDSDRKCYVIYFKEA
ncbi:hypothetical protein CIB95_08780 [Lottiidibacillus patelloidae]|uniref:RNA helicase n=1 Tax=Lottiidibacillus patelloidae TaxID=2670334 RepID=A0A263BUK1_9BACI|nr:hypothetical protein [Lottiidibacillus patelloidae]OZM56856.1 hypothetical protein CIB95_08780 [Lottiidibacillus patelloidae]